MTKGQIMDPATISIEEDDLSLQLTEAALEAMNDPNKMSARERQFCLLLQHEDSVSQRACLHLLVKIDVSSLISKGYLVDNASVDPQATTAAQNSTLPSDDQTDSDDQSANVRSTKAIKSVFNPAALNKSWAKQRDTLRKSRAKTSVDGTKQTTDAAKAINPALQLIVDS